MFERPANLPGEMGMGHGMAHGNGTEAPMGAAPEPILERRVADGLLQARDQAYTLGFRHINEVERLDVIPSKILERLWKLFSHLFYRAWSAKSIFR